MEDEIKIRLRLPSSVKITEYCLPKSTLWGSVIASVEREVPDRGDRELTFLSGFPPKEISNGKNEEIHAFLRSGELIIVQIGEAKIERGVINGRYVPPCHERDVFVCRTCPADNSCLFHAAAYVLHDKSRTYGPSIRKECATAVLQRKSFYNEAVLGMTPEAYANWLLNPSSWGGGIELAILSELYETEILALNQELSRIEHFGIEKGYTLRAFVIYTGQHYDAMAMAPSFDSTNEALDQVLFNERDTRVEKKAIQFLQYITKKSVRE